MNSKEMKTMGLEARLVQRGNRLYVESATLSFDEPKRIISRWRVNAINGDWEIGQLLTWNCGCWQGSRVQIGTEQLPTPEESEVQDVAVPKTKLQVRWQNGYWQKYTASKGWVIA